MNFLLSTIPQNEVFTTREKSTYSSCCRWDSLRILIEFQVEKPVDIFLSHDWPITIAPYGDLNFLYKVKPFLKNEVIIR